MGSRDGQVLAFLAGISVSGGAALVFLWWQQQRRGGSSGRPQLQRQLSQPILLRSDSSRVTRCAGPRPSLLQDVNIGSCVERWTDEYLKEKLGDVSLSFHASEGPFLSFVAKNFAYEAIPLSNFFENAYRTGADKRYWYYRSENSKRAKLNSPEIFRRLRADFSIPEELLGGGKVHSEVLRIASAGLKMWLHYDICDNYLCVIRGRKRVLLFPPDDVGKLYIEEPTAKGSSFASTQRLEGSSSKLGSRLMATSAGELSQVWKEFPKAKEAWKNVVEFVMEEGDVLFLPAMWFHCTEALPKEGEEGGLCISTNVFYIRPEMEALHDPKDIWANRELLPAQAAFKHYKEKVYPQLQSLPPRERMFYCRKTIAALEAEIDEALKDCTKSCVSGLWTETM